MRKDTSREIPGLKNGHTQEVRCNVRRLIVQFWKWFYTSPVVNELIRKLGFAPLPSFLTNQVLQKFISDIKCDGSQVYAEEIPPSLPGFGSSVAIKPIELFTLAYTIVEPQTKINYQDFHTFVDMGENSQDSIGPISMLNSVEKILLSNITTAAFTIVSSSPIFLTSAAREKDRIAAQAFNSLMSQAWRIRGLFNQMIDQSVVEDINKQDENLLGFPFFAAAVVPAYVLNDDQNQAINLTLSVIADLMLGAVSMWNDIQMQNLNPSYPLLEQKMHIVIEDEFSEKNLLLSTALCSVSSTYCQKIGGPSANFASKLDSETIIKVPNEKHTRATVINTKGTIGFVLVVGSNAGMRLANLQIVHKKESVAISSGIHTMTPCLYQLAESRGWKTENRIKDSPCWPLTFMVEMVLKRAYEQNAVKSQIKQQSQRIDVQRICPLAHQLLSFSSWLFTDEEMGIPIQELNMADVASQNNLRDSINLLLEEATCEGDSLIANYDICTSNDYFVSFSGCTSEKTKLSASFFWKQPKTCRRGVILPSPVDGLNCG